MVPNNLTDYDYLRYSFVIPCEHIHYMLFLLIYGVTDDEIF